MSDFKNINGNNIIVDGVFHFRLNLFINFFSVSSHGMSSSFARPRIASLSFISSIRSSNNRYLFRSSTTKGLFPFTSIEYEPVFINHFFTKLQNFQMSDKIIFFVTQSFTEGFHRGSQRYIQ